jgi:hypothetical protein
MKPYQILVQELELEAYHSKVEFYIYTLNGWNVKKIRICTKSISVINVLYKHFVINQGKY